MNETEIAKGLSEIADALRRLGNADAATPMGGLEAHGAAIKEAGSELVEAAEHIAEAIEELSDSMDAVAEAIQELTGLKGKRVNE